MFDRGICFLPHYVTFIMFNYVCHSSIAPVCVFIFKNCASMTANNLQKQIRYAFVHSCWRYWKCSGNIKFQCLWITADEAHFPSKTKKISLQLKYSVTESLTCVVVYHLAATVIITWSCVSTSQVTMTTNHPNAGHWLVVRRIIEELSIQGIEL